MHDVHLTMSQYLTPTLVSAMKKRLEKEAMEQGDDD